MNCIHTLKYLNIFLTTFFTFLLVLFAFFQWQAIKKQNNQNLFKMRLEHSSNLHNIWMDTFLIIEKLVDDSNTKELREQLCYMINKLEKIIPESEYLFDMNFMAIEGNIIELLRNLLQYLKSPINIDKNQYFKNIAISLDDAGSKYKSLCDAFLKF